MQHLRKASINIKAKLINPSVFRVHSGNDPLTLGWNVREQSTFWALCCWCWWWHSTIGSHHCLCSHCIPAQSSLKLRLNTKLTALTHHSPPCSEDIFLLHLNKNSREEEEFSHLCVCVCVISCSVCVWSTEMKLHQRWWNNPLSLSQTALPPRSPSLLFFPRHSLFFLHLPLSLSFTVFPQPAAIFEEQPLPLHYLHTHYVYIHSIYEVYMHTH